MYGMYIQEIVQRAEMIQWINGQRTGVKQFTKGKRTSKQVNRKIFTS